MSLNDRILKGAALSYLKVSEIIEACYDDPLDIVLSLIIEDGNPKRTHRNYLFNNQYNLIGLASYRHIYYEHITVIIFGKVDKL